MDMEQTKGEGICEEEEAELGIVAMLLILLPGRLLQGDCHKIEASLGYIVRFRPAWVAA